MPSPAHLTNVVIPEPECPYLSKKHFIGLVYGELSEAGYEAIAERFLDAARRRIRPDAIRRQAEKYVTLENPDSIYLYGNLQEVANILLREKGLDPDNPYIYALEDERPVTPAEMKAQINEALSSFNPLEKMSPEMLVHFFYNGGNDRTIRLWDDSTKCTEMLKIDGMLLKHITSTKWDFLCKAAVMQNPLAIQYVPVQYVSNKRPWNFK